MLSPIKIEHIIQYRRFILIIRWLDCMVTIVANKIISNLNLFKFDVTI
jgi:hypothetical protein